MHLLQALNRRNPDRNRKISERKEPFTEGCRYGAEIISCPFRKGGTHKIQGIGAGYVPDVLDTKLMMKCLRLKMKRLQHWAARDCKKEGVLVGISSGAAYSAAIELAKRRNMQERPVVAILPDSGDRYYSTALFQEALT